MSSPFRGGYFRPPPVLPVAPFPKQDSDSPSPSLFESSTSSGTTNSDPDEDYVDIVSSQMEDDLNLSDQESETSSTPAPGNNLSNFGLEPMDRLNLLKSIAETVNIYNSNAPTPIPWDEEEDEQNEAGALRGGGGGRGQNETHTSPTNCPRPGNLSMNTSHGAIPASSNYPSRNGTHLGQVPGHSPFYMLQAPTLQQSSNAFGLGVSNGHLRQYVNTLSGFPTMMDNSASRYTANHSHLTSHQTPTIKTEYPSTFAPYYTSPTPQEPPQLPYLRMYPMTPDFGVPPVNAFAAPTMEPPCHCAQCNIYRRYLFDLVLAQNCRWVCSCGNMACEEHRRHFLPPFGF